MAKLPKNDPKALIAAMEADLHATDGADLSGLVFKGLKVDKQILFENANLKRADFRNARRKREFVRCAPRSDAHLEKITVQE